MHYHDLVHQLFGWPAYLLFNASVQELKGTQRITAPHFVAITIACLSIAGQFFRNRNVIVPWGIPWLWANHWIGAITFLRNTDASLLHYDDKSWAFARRAANTIHPSLGFIDRHLFHSLIGTDVCHHPFSTITFYHAAEASAHIRMVMVKHYKADFKTNFRAAFWKNRLTCSFVQKTEGKGELRSTCPVAAQIVSTFA